MPDYIIFENWPDIEKYKRGHEFDSMTDEEIFGIYLEEKNKNPKISDEALSERFGRSPYYFYYIKKKMKKRRNLCEQKLLQSV